MHVKMNQDKRLWFCFRRKLLELAIYNTQHLIHTLQSKVIIFTLICHVYEDIQNHINFLSKISKYLSIKCEHTQSAYCDLYYTSLITFIFKKQSSKIEKESRKQM